MARVAFGAWTAQYQYLEAHDTGDVDVYPGSLQPIFGDLTQEKVIAQPQRVENEIYNATINWNLDFPPP